MGLTAGALAGLVAGAAGVGIQAIAAQQQAVARRGALDYNATIAEYNAQAADVQAEQARKNATLEEKEFRTRVDRLKASQRTSFAASGVLVDSGSSLDVLADTAGQAEQDVLDIRFNAANEIFGHQTRAQNFRSQGKLLKAQRPDPSAAFRSTLLTRGLQFGAQVGLGLS